MTQPIPPDEWDLEYLTQLVTQNDLERGRIEYKRELGDGGRTLDAIAALANTFGGVVLVGVDEKKPAGPERIIGVDARDRDRLSRMCRDRLVPPFSPDIVPIKLDHDDKFVLAVIVEPAYARRPIMLTQGNKVLVRIEGHSVPADWYRLRDLFTEQPDAFNAGGLTARSVAVDPPPRLGEADPPLSFGIRGQLWLGSPRGRSYQITEPARQAALMALNKSSSPITGDASGLINLMHRWIQQSWGSSRWQLHGPNSSQRIQARWQALVEKMRLAEARLTIELPSGRTGSQDITIQLDVLLAYPFDQPTLSLGQLGGIILDTTRTLWGPLGEALSTALYGQPLGPPAELAISLACLPDTQGQRAMINDIIHFGGAQLIPDNTPGSGQEYETISPSRDFLDPDTQETTVRQWLTGLAVNHGYQNVQQEVDRHILR